MIEYSFSSLYIKSGLFIKNVDYNNEAYENGIVRLVRKRHLSH